MNRALAPIAGISVALAGSLALAETDTPLLAGIENVYSSAAKLKESAGPLVCLIDIHHPDSVRRKLRGRERHFYLLEQFRLRIELGLAGLPCLLLHYAQVDWRDMERENVRAIILSSRSKGISAELDRELLAFLKTTKKPVLALDGSHRFMAYAYGGKGGRMRKLRPGEKDPYPGYARGFFKEWGLTRVRILRPDALFNGLRDTIAVHQRHAWEIKTLPKEFELLASTKECRVQAFKHKGKPLYGLQFHAELYDDAHDDGRAVLRNFFRIAGIDTKKTVPAAVARFRATALGGADEAYATPAQLRSYKKPFVCFVHMEHPAVIRERRGRREGAYVSNRMETLKDCFQFELSGLPCLVVHYAQVTRRDFENPALQAIVLSGAGSPAIKPLIGEIHSLIKDTRKPLLGICAGHQHVAKAYGSKVAAMRRLKEGEKDPAPFYQPGMFKEWGYTPVQIVKDDALFRGLPRTVTMHEAHAGEAEHTPKEFDLLASNKTCRVQAIKHKERVLYGTQFHPERYDMEHPDGMLLLRNFFKEAGIDAEGRLRESSQVFASKALRGLESYYGGVDRLRAGREPVVCIMDPQPPRVIRTSPQRHADALKRLSLQIEKLSATPCLVLHAVQMTPEILRSSNVRAIIITTRKGRISARCDRDVFRLIRQADVPILGISGGQNVVALAYGAKLGPMRGLRPGEKDPYPRHAPGKFKEWGMTQVRIVKRDPLFEGLGDEITVDERHAYEIKELPEKFQVLASTDECEVQALRHKRRLLYGVQFNAHRYSDRYPDGGAVLRNFLQMERIE